MPLTALACERAKPGEKDRVISDSGGLYLCVRRGGTKQWQFRYRFDGKQKKLTLGEYPRVTLHSAREMRSVVRSYLDNGRDPREVDLSEYSPVTFEQVAHEWYELQSPKWTTGHSQRVWSRVEGDLLGPFGERPVASITRKEVLTALRRIETRGAIETAKRVSQYANQIFEFALSEEHVEFNPAVNLTKSLRSNPPTKHHPKLTEQELPEFFDRLSRYEGERTRIGLKLVMHTFVRTSELLGVTADELDFKEGLWRIPGERMKRSMDHIVPLTPATTTLFKSLIEMTPDGGRLLPISANTMIFAMYRMGYHTKATVHGFRSTASTVLNECGLWRSDAIERQLAHVPDDQVRAAYNAAQYLPERIEMMQWWSSFLDEREAASPDLVDDFEDLLNY